MVHFEILIIRNVFGRPLNYLFHFLFSFSIIIFNWMRFDLTRPDAWTKTVHLAFLCKALLAPPRRHLS